jgi:hypothetical protein
MNIRTMVSRVAGVILVGACRVNGPVGDHPSTAVTSPDPSLASETTREVLTKRAPDMLVARDGSSCRVTPTVYETTAVGSQLRCPWVPGTMTPQPGSR